MIPGQQSVHLFQTLSRTIPKIMKNTSAHIFPKLLAFLFFFVCGASGLRGASITLEIPNQFAGHAIWLEMLPEGDAPFQLWPYFAATNPGNVRVVVANSESWSGTPFNLRDETTGASLGGFTVGTGEMLLQPGYNDLPGSAGWSRYCLAVDNPRSGHVFGLYFQTESLVCVFPVSQTQPLTLPDSAGSQMALGFFNATVDTIPDYDYSAALRGL